MFLVTNREVDEASTTVKAFGDGPNPKGPNELRLAEATRKGGSWRIRILPDTITQPMAAEVGLVPDKDPVTNKELPIYASRYVARKVLASVNPAVCGIKGKKGRHLVFFVHGFNNDVQSVLDRAEGIRRTYGVEVVPFSWPANGGGVKGVASYKSDKRDALASVGAFDRALARLHQFVQEIHAERLATIEALANKKHGNDAAAWDAFFTKHAEAWCGFSVNLFAHSMGNYILKHHTGSSVYRNNLLVFDNALLVAADTNSEGHAEWIDRIPVRRRLFVTINEDDGALAASRLKMGEAQKARLGHYPYGLDARRAVYVDFTGQKKVGDSHAYFEGDPIGNPVVKQFFNAAFRGECAERGLPYDVASNRYIVR